MKALPYYPDGPDGGDVIAAVWRDGRLHSLNVRMRPQHLFRCSPCTCQPHLATYDVDWCTRDGVYYYHESGGGPFIEGGKGDHVWLAAGWHWTTDCERIQFLNIPLREMVDSAVIWCNTCQDNLPKDTGYGDDTCEHLHWCERHGEYAGDTFDGCGCKLPAEDGE